MPGARTKAAHTQAAPTPAAPTPAAPAPGDQAPGDQATGTEPVSETVTAATSIDIPFAVPFTHRLRVTQDVTGDDFSVLRQLLDGGDAGPAKVLVVVESQVAAANPRNIAIGDRLAGSDGIDLVAQPFLIDGG